MCVGHQEYLYSFVTIFGEAESFRCYRESPGIEDKNILNEPSDLPHWMRKNKPNDFSRSVVRNPFMDFWYP